MCVCMFCHSLKPNIKSFAEEMFYFSIVTCTMIACGSSFHKAGPATENARLPHVSNLVLSTVNYAWEAERRVRDG